MNIRITAVILFGLSLIMTMTNVASVVYWDLHGDWSWWYVGLNLWSLFIMCVIAFWLYDYQKKLDKRALF